MCLTAASDPSWPPWRKTSESRRQIKGVTVSLATREVSLEPAKRSKGSMPDLLREIEIQITGAKVSTAKQSVGTIREIGDGRCDAQRNAEPRSRRHRAGVGPR